MAILSIAILLAAVGAGGDDPRVKTLLESPGEKDFQHPPPFFEALVSLAREQGLDPGRYSGFDKGRAVAFGTGHDRCVVAILDYTGGNPQPYITRLVLMDPQGRFLDELLCRVSGKYGKMRTEAWAKPEEDGAQLVVRFVPHHAERSIWHPQHEITWKGKAYTFEEPVSHRDQPSESYKKGLCRIAIRDGKFVILYPKLEDAKRVVDRHLQ